MAMLYQKDEYESEKIIHTFEGIEDSDIVKLQEAGLLFVSEGRDHQAGVQILSLTAKGQEFIKSFCVACECMPCDCDWGCA